MPTSNKKQQRRVHTPQDPTYARDHLEIDAEKGEDELELEAVLFGRKRKRVVASGSGFGLARNRKGKGKGRDGTGAQEEDEDTQVDDMGAGGLSGDLDGFFMDVGGMPGVSLGGPSRSQTGDELEGDLEEDRVPGHFMDLGPPRGISSGEDGGEEQDDSNESQEDSDGDSNADSDDDEGFNSDASSASNPNANTTFTSIAPSTATSRFPFGNSSSSSSKPAIWSDPADALASVNPSTDKRLRKILRGTKEALKGDEIEWRGGEGGKLEQKLREGFQKMHPEPAWAKQAKSNALKSKSDASKSTIAQTLLSSLLTNTTPIIPTSTINNGPLPQGVLSIKRLPDANKQNPTGSDTAGKGGGGIKEVRFLKTRGMERGRGVLAVVGGDMRLRMFSIDGVTNPSLLTLHIPSLPLSTAQFHPSGTSLYLAGARNFFYTYDLRSQRCLRSPANLLGSVAPSLAEGGLQKSTFSPDGSLLAVAGRKGAIHILSWGASGVGQLVMTLNSGRQGGVKDLMWMQDGREIWVLGEGSMVDVWDVGARRIKWRWVDDGGFGGTMLRRSADSDYCAVGSSTGIVNVYNINNISPGEDNGFGDLPSAAPKPIRSLMNLTTALSTLEFNHDGQMLAVASDKKGDAFRAFQLPTATAFTNWPTQQTPLGSVTSADFSAASEYVAIGNTKGKVLLYSVSHYHES